MPTHLFCKYNFVADSTGIFKDGAHAYFYKNKITEQILNVLKVKHFSKTPYIEIIGTECKTGKWTGKEPFEKYLDAKDFESWVYLYLEAGKTDVDYAVQIRNILELLYEDSASLYNITLEIRLNDNKIDCEENMKGTCIFSQDLNQYNLKIDFWTKKNILDNMEDSRLLHSYY